MMPPDLRPRRLLLLVGVAILLLATAGSSFFQRYVRCQNKAMELAAAEGLHRARVGTLEEVANNLREVASLARQMAGSATSEFERSKWLGMARTEELKADKFDKEAVQAMSQADVFAAQADEFFSLSWRPWLPSPD